MVSPLPAPAPPYPHQDNILLQASIVSGIALVRNGVSIERAILHVAVTAWKSGHMEGENCKCNCSGGGGH